MEYPSDQFGSPAPVMSPPIFPGTPSIQASIEIQKAGNVSKPCPAIKNHHYIITTLFCTNSKQTLITSTVKKINSPPAKTRTWINEETDAKGTEPIFPHQKVWQYFEWNRQCRRKLA